MQLKSVVVAVAAIVAASTASAVSYSFVMPVAPAAPSGNFAVASAPGPFTDFWNFLGPIGGVQASGSTISVDLQPFTNVDSLQLTLFTGMNGMGTQLAIGGTAESSELQNIAIIAGTQYSFRITGNVVGAPVGYYVFSAIAAPIPEPETYALMLGGLGVVGFMAMRRRRQG